MVKNCSLSLPPSSLHIKSSHSHFPPPSSAKTCVLRRIHFRLVTTELSLVDDPLHQHIIDEVWALGAGERRYPRGKQNERRGDSVKWRERWEKGRQKEYWKTEMERNRVRERETESWKVKVKHIKKLKRKPNWPSELEWSKCEKIRGDEQRAWWCAVHLFECWGRSNKMCGKSLFGII